MTIRTPLGADSVKSVNLKMQDHPSFNPVFERPGLTTPRRAALTQWKSMTYPLPGRLASRSCIPPRAPAACTLIACFQLLLWKRRLVHREQWEETQLPRHYPLPPTIHGSMAHRWVRLLHRAVTTVVWNPRGIVVGTLKIRDGAPVFLAKVRMNRLGGRVIYRANHRREFPRAGNFR